MLNLEYPSMQHLPPYNHQLPDCAFYQAGNHCSLSPGHNTFFFKLCVNTYFHSVTICSTLPWDLTIVFTYEFLHLQAQHISTTSAMFSLWLGVIVGLVYCCWWPHLHFYYTFCLYLGKLTHLSKGMMFCTLCKRYNKEITICMGL